MEDTDTLTSDEEDDYEESEDVDMDLDSIVVDGWFEQTEEQEKKPSAGLSKGLAHSLRKIRNQANFQSVNDIEEHMSFRRRKKKEELPTITSQTTLRPSKKQSRSTTVPLKYNRDTATTVLTRSLSKQLAHAKFRKFCQSKDFLKQRNRLRAMREIIDTERTHVRLMKAFAEVYLQAVQEQNRYANRSGSFLNRKTAMASASNSISQMFKYTEQIVSVNQTLLSGLEDEFKAFPNTMLSKPFTQYAPYLKVYVDYINGYDEAMETYTKLLAKNEKFKEAMLACEAVPQVENHSFEALLILPVQRIPRYRLLLNELLQNTEPDHTEFESIKQALDAIIGIAVHVNEQKRYSDYQLALSKVSQIANHIHGKEMSAIFTASRKLLRDPEKLYISVTEANAVGREDTVIKCYMTFFYDDLLVLVERELYEVFTPPSKERDDKDTEKDPDALQIVYYAFSRLIPSTSIVDNAFTVETISKGKRIQYRLIDSIEQQENILYETYNLLKERIMWSSSNMIDTSMFEYASHRCTLENTKKEKLMAKKRLQASEEITRKQFMKMKIMVNEKELLLKQIQMELAELTKACTDFGNNLEDVQNRKTKASQEVDTTLSTILTYDQNLMKTLQDQTYCFKQVFDLSPVLTMQALEQMKNELNSAEVATPTTPQTPRTPRIQSSESENKKK